jgi:stage V sporulation protein B
MLEFTNLNIYAVVIGNIIFALIICVLNAWEIKRTTGYRQEIYKSFLVPIISSVVMGIAAYMVYFALNTLTKSIKISFVVAFAVAVIVYAVVFLRMKGFTEDELASLPKGTMLVSIAKKFHLI